MSAVDDGGTRDPQHLAPGRLDLADLVGHLTDLEVLRLLARHDGVHELEDVLVVGLLHRDEDLDPAGAAHDAVPGSDVAHRDRRDAHSVGVVAYQEPAVHLRVLDVHPVAADAHLGVEVGRRVEVVGEDAVLLDGAHHGLARVDEVRAVGLQPHDQPAERLLVVGADAHPGVRLVVRALADVEPLDGEVAAEVEDVVEQPREVAGVDEVAPHLDGFGDGHGGLPPPGTRVRPRRRRRPRRPDGLRDGPPARRSLRGRTPRPAA
jgi:hypothetical protein